VKVAVGPLKNRPTWLEARESPQELGPPPEGAEFISPVEVSVKLTRMQEDVLAQGEARTTARVQCSRCLADIELSLAGRFEALYVPDAGAYAKRMGQPKFEWGDQRVSFYSELTIDLTNEIRQCLLLELPMKPLCRPDCAGLCTQCGQDLNQGPCNCQPDKEDDIWGPLRKLIPPTDDRP